MFKILLFIGAAILIYKYWEQVKNAAAVVFISVFSVMFVIVMYIHHSLKTWYMLKRK